MCTHELSNAVLAPNSVGFSVGCSIIILNRPVNRLGAAASLRGSFFLHESLLRNAQQMVLCQRAQEHVLNGVDVQQLVDEHFERIHRAALVLCGNPWDAEDMAQETFLLAARNAHCFQRGQCSLYMAVWDPVERRAAMSATSWNLAAEVGCPVPMV
jgi:hypothetical protein